MSESPTLEERFSGLVYGAIQDATNSTARSKQQQEFRLGVSNIGHCRQYAKYITEQRAFTDVRDKTAAFYGTVLGDAIESQIAKSHPDWLTQHETVFHIPSGGEILGHADLIIPAAAATDEYPQGVTDFKSKAELDTVRRVGRTQQQDFQLTMYAKGCIDEGLLDPSKPIYLTNVYFDRAAKGGGMMPYSITTEYDERTLETIDEWIGDVKYAVVHDQDASRDLPREFCAAYCEYFTTCRSGDTDAEGLLTDPEVLAAVDMYREGGALEREGRRLKDSAKVTLKGVSGSTGEFVVRPVEVGPAEMKAYTRAGFTKIDVRPVPKGKR